MLLLCILVGGVSNAWAADQTITLTYNSFGLTTSYSEKTATVSGFGFAIDQGYKGSGNVIQMNSSKGNGILYNTTAIPGLKSIKVTVSSVNKTYTITTGTSEKPTANSQTGSSTGTYNAASGDTFFQLKVSGACYFSSIEITYTPTHTLTYSATNGSIGGLVYNTSTAVASGASVAEGGMVTLTAQPEDGYEFTGWNVTGTGSSLSSPSTNPTTFTMGTENATVTATFEAVSTTKVITPTFTVEEGTYNVAQSVKLSCKTDGATIYYTTNGDTPTSSSTEYTGSAIAVNTTTTIKAIAVKNGLDDSEVASAIYTLKCVAPSFDPVAGSVGYGTEITLSTTTEGVTLYYTTNGDTPTSSSSAYDSSNKPTVSGNQTFKAIATKTGWSDSDVSSAAYTYYYVITVQSNNVNYGKVSGTTTITAIPEEGYRVVAGDGGYTVTNGSATVTNNGDNTFTVEAASNCTVQINFEAIPTHTVTFSINGDVSRTATVQEDAAITFPTAVASPSDAMEFPKTSNGKTFVGWYTSEYTHASTAPSYVNTSTAKMSTSDVTYYAVYAITSGGSYTLDYGNESSLSSSNSWGSYGTAYNYTATDGSAWTVKAYKSTGMQINTGKDCSIKMPSCPGNIQSVKITCSAAKAVGISSSDYSGSGTITYLAYGSDATSQTIDMTSQTATTGYIVPKSGSTSITKIVVEYMNASAFTTDARSDAGIAFANAEVDVKLTSGYTGQALVNENSVSVTYSSSDETVATVNSSTGAITELLKVGSTTITASFAGNATYKPTEVSYTLNVTEKTPAGLAYAISEVEKLTTDDAFTNTLTNSHSLTVTYSSSVTGVATVNSSTGEVTIKGAGSTTITATFTGNEDYEAGNASYTLAVSKAAPTLSFASANAIGRVEEAFAGNALTNPASLSVSYSSSDEDVATVDSETGEVTIVAAGTTTITASFSGNDTYTSGSANYTLKVLDNPTILVENTVIAWGETFTVDNSVIEGGDITVTSGETKIATVDGLVITPVACGSVTITVSTAENEDYKAGSETFTLTITAPEGSDKAPSSDVTYTFDFTDNKDWGFPTDYATGEKTYTKAGKTITLNTPDDKNGYKFNSGVILFGKEGATLTLPAFDKPVTKISTTGVSGASAKVTQNIFVGSTAVSTETTSAKDDQEYEIDEDYQDVGTIYILKVTNGNNTQLSDLTVHMYQAPSTTVTLNKNGFATYCSVNPMDFSSTSGYTAWRISDISAEGVVTFTKITEKIKGGQGVILYNKDADGVNTSTATIKFADGTTEFTAAENLLVGTTAPTFVNQEVGDYTNFALSAANGDFRKIKAEGMVVPANKAYLPVPTDKIPKTAARLTFVFEDGEQTTGISEECRVKSEEFAPAIYDLQGRKVAQPKKGLYIVNGRKVVMK